MPSLGSLVVWSFYRLHLVEERENILGKYDRAGLLSVCCSKLILIPSSGDLRPFTAKGLAGNHSDSSLSTVENHLQLR